MGKFSVLMVIGLCAVLMIMGPNMYRFANNGYKNYLDYEARMISHNIAVSGVNIAANALFLNNQWITGYTNVSFNGGTFTVKVDSSQLALTGLYRKRLTSISTYGGNHDTVIVTFQPSNFAEFCVYLQNMAGGVSWATGDTVWGPCHIDSVMGVSGTPVFYGKTTTKNGTNPSTLPSGSTNPKFYGGYQSGVSIPMPTSFAKAETSASQNGKVFSYTGSGTYVVNFTFNNDSTVTYRQIKNGVKDSNTTVKINTLAPNGTIWVKNGNVTMKTSTLKGKCTIIVSGAASSTTQGNIVIGGNIKYSSDPSLTGTGTDMLGLCADNNIQVHAPDTLSYPTIPAQHDVIVESALFTRTGKFYTDLYNNSSATGLGMVKVIGSLVSKSIGAFSTPDASGNVKYGYRNLFLFDNRFYNSFPPNYPVTGYYNIVAWKE
jgi:hypothetical protein